MSAAPVRLALLAVLALAQLVPGCGILPDHRTVQQAVDDAVAAEPARLAPR